LGLFVVCACGSTIDLMPQWVILYGFMIKAHAHIQTRMHSMGSIKMGFVFPIVLSY